MQTPPDSAGTDRPQLREHTTPLLVDPGERTVTDLLLERVATAPDHVAFEVRAATGELRDPWRPVTTDEFAEQARRLAKGLIATGVLPGQSVGIMAATRYEWAVADFACWFAGAVVVPIYETAALGQARAVLADADIALALAGTTTQADLLALAFEQAARSPIGIWTMDPQPGKDLAALVDLGAPIGDDEVEYRRSLATPDSVATIVYTSGTTAAPKGARITHRNFVHQVLNIAEAYSDVVRDSGSTIIFLPLAHVLARGLQLICLAGGMRIAHLARPEEVVPALGALRPTFLVVVPRVLQKIHAAAGQAAAEAHLSRLWAAAERTAIEWGSHRETRQATPDARPPFALRLRHALFDRLFYRRLRTRLGGRIDYLLSGAAALDADLCRFFLGAGIPVIEGYGLTETTAPLTGNLPGSIRAGSVGAPLPGMTVRISAEGEVLARGGGVITSYHHDTEPDAFRDGFFHTGDLGELDAEGRLTLRGRLKDVVVTAGGKTVTPTDWERSVESNPLVAHAVMIGEGKPYLGGLILLDPEALDAWATESADPLPALPEDDTLTRVTDHRLVEAVAAAVHAANQQLARSEQVRRFSVLLANLSEELGLVTPTMKLKRNALLERARHLVEELYR